MDVSFMQELINCNAPAPEFDCEYFFGFKMCDTIYESMLGELYFPEEPTREVAYVTATFFTALFLAAFCKVIEPVIE